MTRDEGEGYGRAELFYHRGTDSFDALQTLDGAEGTERITVGYDPLRERRPYVPQGLYFLFARNVQVDGSGGLRRRFLFLFPLGLAEAGVARRICGFDLVLEGPTGAGIGRRPTV
jgi:hypothetical protein